MQAELTQTESLSYFFCCDQRCRRCPCHAGDIISNYWIFQGSASGAEWTMWTSQHRNIPAPSNCIQTFIRGLVMRYNLITWKLHFPWNVISYSSRRRQILSSMKLVSLLSKYPQWTFSVSFVECRYLTEALVWGRNFERVLVVVMVCADVRPLPGDTRPASLMSHSNKTPTHWSDWDLDNWQYKLFD